MSIDDPYETLTLDMSEAEQEACIRSYVTLHLAAPAAYTFNDLISTGTPIQDALYQAVLNDFIHQALVEAVERSKEEQDDKTLD